LKVRNLIGHTEPSRQPILNSDLKPMLDFVMARAGAFADMAILIFRDAADSETCHGLATKQWEHGTCVVPSVAEVWVSEDVPERYPMTQQHVEELAPFQIESWAEELLVVTAHEIRHIVQFWTSPGLDPYDMEVDAEAFAIETLNAWRRAHAVNKRKAA
jgi:hypothetical protein